MECNPSCLGRLGKVAESIHCTSMTSILNFRCKHLSWSSSWWSSHFETRTSCSSILFDLFSLQKAKVVEHFLWTFPPSSIISSTSCFSFDIKLKHQKPPKRDQEKKRVVFVIIIICTSSFSLRGDISNKWIWSKDVTMQNKKSRKTGIKRIVKHAQTHTHTKKKKYRITLLRVHVCLCCYCVLWLCLSYCIIICAFDHRLAISTN